jgi:hypothetical protein
VVLKKWALETFRTQNLRTRFYSRFSYPVVNFGKHCRTTLTEQPKTARTTRTRHPGQESCAKTIDTIDTRQPGRPRQPRQDTRKGYLRQITRGSPGTGQDTGTQQLRHDIRDNSQDRTAFTGHLESWNRTPGTGHSGQETRER